MDAEKKELWATALESGRFKQGKGKLEAGGEHCCLGVLCRVAIENGLDIRVEPYEHSIETGEKPTAFDDATNYPPESVEKWAGFDTDNPMVEVEELGAVSLVSLNDTYGYTFEEIAKLIREQL
ncbi:hypothetical protein AB0C87_24840 [Actinomadura sp. NPDC048021]|uniref:hypothetical protein n=1 Tax=Actinomadura sp. NPDC048021 TaxID=3155385 RepID=UPI0034096AE9